MKLLQWLSEQEIGLLAPFLIGLGILLVALWPVLLGMAVLLFALYWWALWPNIESLIESLTLGITSVEDSEN